VSGHPHEPSDPKTTFEPTEPRGEPGSVPRGRFANSLSIGPPPIPENPGPTSREANMFAISVNTPEARDFFVNLVLGLNQM